MQFIFTSILAIPLIAMPFCLAILRFVGFYQQVKQYEDSQEFVLDSLIHSRGESLSFRRGFDFPEFLFMGVSPIIGLFFIKSFSGMISPFDVNAAPTLAVYCVFAWSAYWISRLGKANIPAKLLNILPFGIYIGLLLYPFLAIHFISEITLYGMLLPFFSFPLFAPLPAWLYTLRELMELRNFKAEKAMESLATLGNSSRKILNDSTKHYLGFGAFILLIQVVLVLFGQEWTSIIDVFTGGEDFFFSQY